MSKILISIATYNERENLEPLIDEIKQQLADAHIHKNAQSRFAKERLPGPFIHRMGSA